jgi:hypothetical protein
MDGGIVRTLHAALGSRHSPGLGRTDRPRRHGRRPDASLPGLCISLADMTASIVLIYPRARPDSYSSASSHQEGGPRLPGARIRADSRQPDRADVVEELHPATLDAPADYASL